MKSKVIVQVDKIMQSPTTPCVKLTYHVDIESETAGECGVFDGDTNTSELIRLLEKFYMKSIGLND